MNSEEKNNLSTEPTAIAIPRRCVPLMFVAAIPWSLLVSLAMTLVMALAMALTLPLTARAEGLLDEPLPVTWQTEAALNDVCFVDAQFGWAVGDHGTILRTTDGGKRWKTIAEINQKILQPAGGNLSLKEKLRGVSNRQVMHPQDPKSNSALGVTCQLTSVFFLDRKHGWACGGFGIPHIDRTQSVVLRTQDGGVHWTLLSSTRAPAMRQIHFSSLRSGWAVGDAGHKYRSGIYYTHDGGNNWSTDPPETKRRSWKRAAKQNGATVAISNQGEIGFSASPSATPSAQGATAPGVMDNGAILGATRGTTPHFNDVAWIDEKTAWAVGDAGAVFSSTDQGLSWRPVSLDGDQNLASLDFLSVTAAGNRVWLAGRTGNCLVSIDRSNLHAKFHEAPLPYPLNRIRFVDANNGWAVGEFGSIAVTSNGGETWERQRGRRTGLDILALCLRPDDVPLELLADQACENNRLCGTAVIETRNAPRDTFHLHQAAGRCGSATFTTIPAGVETTPANGNRANALPTNDQRRRDLIQRLAILFRNQQPRCVALHAPYRRQNTSAAELRWLHGDINNIVTEAIHLAADRRFVPTGQNAPGNPPWQVNWLAVTDVAGRIQFSGDKLLPLEGQTIADRIQISRSLLGLSVRSDRTLSFRVLRLLGRGEGGQSMTAVIADRGGLLESGRSGIGRVPRSKGSSGLGIIGRNSDKRHMFERLLATDVHDSVSMTRWQNDLLSLTISVDDHQAGSWVWDLADRCYRSGKPELASRTLQMLVQRWPEHAYATAAHLWLATYCCSDEYNRTAFYKAKAAAISLATSTPQTSDIGSDSHDSIRAQALTEIQSDIVGGGDRRIAWQASDPDLLKRKTQAARAARQQRGMNQVLRSGDSDLAELIKLSGQLDQATDAQSTGDTVSAEAEDLQNERRAQVLKQIESDFDLQQWMPARHRLAAKFLRRLSSQDPDFADSSQCQAIHLRLAMAATDRDGITELLNQKIHQTADDSVKQTMLFERQLAQRAANDFPETIHGRPTMRCCRATARPKLDGVANDEIWQTSWQAGAMHARPLYLPNEAKEEPDGPVKLVTFESDIGNSGITASREARNTTQREHKKDALMFAHDEQFLYLIASMNKLPDDPYRPTQKNRTRNPKLDGRDRIEFEIDTDRDGQTTYRFAIDYRGWATESLDSVSDWDPTWFVANRADENTWTVEAAIPIAALMGNTASIDTASPKTASPENTTSAQPALKNWCIRFQRTRWSHEHFWRSRYQHDATKEMAATKEKGTAGAMGESGGFGLADLIRPKIDEGHVLLFETQPR